MNGDFVYQAGDSTESSDDAALRDDCPECGDTALVVDGTRGEVVCSSCGCVVLTEQVDTGPEWTAFDSHERQRKQRVGAPTTRTLHDHGLTTTIDWQHSTNGTEFSARKRSRLRRLQTWQERIRTENPGERNLRHALAEINRMGSALGVPDPVREDAASLYRTAAQEGLVQGRSIEGIATGVLYIACRRAGIPRSLDEVDEVSRVDRVEIGRAYRYVAAELELRMKPLQPRQFLPRFCSALDLGSEVQRQAAAILETAAEEGLLAGRSPPGAAGAAIYYASRLLGEKRTQSEVADVARVTEMTIRNMYQDQATLEDDIPRYDSPTDE